MSKFLLALVLVIGCMVSGSAVQAEVIWSEDFSDVGEWGVISDPGGGSTITVVDGLGAMQINEGKNTAAFGPNPVSENFIPFDPGKKDAYAINWKIDKLTDSVSWDIAIDEFDSNQQYINTIWYIYPAKGSTNEKGEFSKSFGNKTWNSKTSYIIPKVTVYSGNGQQTVYFSRLEVIKK